MSWVKNGIIRSPWKKDPESIPRIPVHKYMLQKLEENLTSLGDQDWLVNAVTGEKSRYSEILPKSSRLASVLSKHGFGHGDILMMYCRNSHQYFFPTLAAWMCGGGVTSVAPGLLPHQVVRQAQGSKPVVLVCDEDTYSRAAHVANDYGAFKLLITIGCARDGAYCFEEVFKEEEFKEDVPIDVEKDIAWLPFSSGTTGLPKGIAHTHRTTLASIFSFSGTARPGFRLFCATNMFHSSGFIAAMSGIQNFQTVYFLPEYKDDWFLQAIEKWKPEAVFSLPPPLVMMAKHPNLSKYDLSSVKYIVFGGALMSRTTEEVLWEKIPNILGAFQGYGMTECGAITTSLSGASTDAHLALPSLEEAAQKSTRTLGSVGRPNPYAEIKVVDPQTGEVQPPGKVGEICVKSPMIMKGYLNNPEATKNTIMDGWCRTGDLGHYDQEGYLYVQERLKELLKYRGYHVVPATLENILLSHPFISEACLVGIPDEEVGELACACVVPKQGENLDPQEVEAFVNCQVSEYEKLRGGAKILAQLKYNAVGKLDRKGLLKELLGEQSRFE